MIFQKEASGFWSILTTAVAAAAAVAALFVVNFSSFFGNMIDALTNINQQDGWWLISQCWSDKPY